MPRHRLAALIAPLVRADACALRPAGAEHRSFRLGVTDDMIEPRGNLSGMGAAGVRVFRLGGGESAASEGVLEPSRATAAARPSASQ